MGEVHIEIGSERGRRRRRKKKKERKRRSKFATSVFSLQSSSLLLTLKPNKPCRKESGKKTREKGWIERIGVLRFLWV